MDVRTISVALSAAALLATADWSLGSSVPEILFRR